MARATRRYQDPETLAIVVEKTFGAQIREAAAAVGMGYGEWISLCIMHALNIPQEAFVTQGYVYGQQLAWQYAHALLGTMPEDPTQAAAHLEQLQAPTTDDDSGSPEQ